MTQVDNSRVAVRDVYNSETGELFRPGDTIPNTEENEVLFKSKKRNGRSIVPGIEDSVRSTATKVASDDRAKPGAGQDGRKPPKKEKIVAKRVAEVEADGDGDVEIGGGERVTPSGGKVQAAPGGALD
ncbi:MAG: hypothetical protein ACRCWJ_15105 [Casimicrobium sp.]